MSTSLYQQEMDKYLSVLKDKTMHALETMEEDIQRLGPMKDHFKIGFLKSANYEYVLKKILVQFFIKQNISVLKSQYNVIAYSWFLG